MKAFVNIRNIIKNHKIVTFVVLMQIVVIFYYLMLCIGNPNNYDIKEGEFDSQWEQAISENENSFCIEEISLKRGSYKVEIEFDIDRSADEYEDTSGHIEFAELDYPAGLRADSIDFEYGYEKVESDINIISFYSTHDLAIKGSIPANYTVSSIHITENVIYRFTRLFVLLIVLCIFDILIYSYLKYISKPNCEKGLVLWFGYIVIWFFASLPAFCGNKYPGHDFVFHISRIISIADNLKAGNFPARLYLEQNNGYSYASALFYCDFFLYLPAFLYVLKLPIFICYNVYVLFVNALTVIFSGKLFSEIFKDKILYILCGVSLYSLSIYRIMDIYTRDAVGEYTAMAFMPLICLGIIRIYSDKKSTICDGLPLIFGMAGIILSHILSTEIVCIALAVFVMLNIKRTLRKDRLMCLILSAIVCAGLCFWFIVPFVDSCSMNCMIFHDRDFRIQEHGAYLSQIFSLFNNTTGISSSFSAYQDTAFSLGGALGIGLILVLYVLMFLKDEESKEYNLIMKESFILCVLFIWLSSVFFPWDIMIKFSQIMKKLLVVQFPWRYLSIAVMMGSIAVSVALYIIGKNKDKLYVVNLVCVGLVMIITGIGYYYYVYAYNTPEEYSYSREYPDNRICVNEYVLNNRDYNLSWEDTFGQEKRYMKGVHYIHSENVDIETEHNSDRVYRILNNSDKEQEIVLPILSYDNYHVIDLKDYSEFEIISERRNQNYITISVPARYEGSIKVDYKIPILWRISEWISVMTLVILIGFLHYDKVRLYESNHSSTNI